MDIYEALKKDHRKVEGLLEQLVNTSPGSNAPVSLIEKIRDELIPHARAEESVLYNSIRSVNTAQDLVWHGYAEHMEAESLLRLLQVEGKIDVTWKKTAEKLQKAVVHHIEEEEGEIFPAAKQLFTHDEAVAMAEVFEKLKPEVKEGGFVQSTLDLVANLMPARLAAPLRTFTLRE